MGEKNSGLSGIQQVTSAEAQHPARVEPGGTAGDGFTGGFGMNTGLLVVVLGELLAPFIIMVFAPGFVGEPLRFGLASQMLRITFPYILLIALTAFCGSILNCFSAFGVCGIYAGAFKSSLNCCFDLVGAAIICSSDGVSLGRVCWGCGTVIVSATIFIT